MSAADVDWATIGAVAAKLRESLAGVGDAEIGADPGSLAAIGRALTLLVQVAGSAGGAR